MPDEKPETRKSTPKAKVTKREQVRTPSRTRSHQSTTSSTSTSTSPATPSPSRGKTASGTERKLAPPEKVTPAIRLAIIEALTEPTFLKALDFSSVAQSFNGEVPSAKLSRHWREVLSGELREYARSGAGKSKSKAKSPAKGGLGREHRLAIWAAVCARSDEADWKGVEEGTGMAASKLRRHLRDVLRKDAEGVIKAA
jgi:outer membrane biosynthesis protein TonB